MSTHNEKPAIKESATFETGSIENDPSLDAHLPTLQAEAKKTGKEQRKVLSSGMHDEGSGSRVLIVDKTGKHKVVFEKEAK